jgi:hypothetical protein
LGPIGGRVKRGELGEAEAHQFRGFRTGDEVNASPKVWQTPTLVPLTPAAVRFRLVGSAGVRR